jgi:hypothetical protein
MLYSPIQVILATLHALYDVGEDCGKHKVGPSVGAGGKSELGGGGQGSTYLQRIFRSRR